MGGGEIVYAAGGQEHPGGVLWRGDYEGEDREGAAAVEDEDWEEEEGVEGGGWRCARRTESAER